jgi:mono/diheme cytochrome c family protein
MALALSANAAQAQTKIKVSMWPTSPADGKAMFDQYCAVCHGKDATGDGASAAALKPAPADLTKISARNGGTFPTAKVRGYIEGLSTEDKRDMPLWRGVFDSLDRNQTQLRVRNLVAYVTKLQTE